MALNKAEGKFLQTAIMKHGLEIDVACMALWFCRVQRIEPNFETFREIRDDADKSLMDLERGE